MQPCDGWCEHHHYEIFAMAIINFYSSPTRGDRGRVAVSRNYGDWSGENVGKGLNFFPHATYRGEGTIKISSLNIFHVHVDN
jgi:hypothetical protein